MRIASLALALLALAACGAQKKGDAFLDQLPPPSLLSADALAADVLLRQHVSATWATGETQFDAVVQKHEGVLRLVALSPTGQPGFVLELHTNGEVSVQNRTGRELPFRAERILADVQKVFYPWIGAEEDLETMRDGTRRARAGGFEVEEELLEGRLVQRLFFSPGTPSSPEVVVSYLDWSDREVAPKLAKIVHLVLGYELTIQTFEEIVLSGLSE